MERKKWTAAEERQLLNLIEEGSQSLNACFMAFAETSGRTPKSVSGHYYHSMKSPVLSNEDPTVRVEEEDNDAPARRWTAEEDALLSRHIDANVTNLKACFLIVAELTGRTPGAVSAHWYSVLSKKDMHFACISKSHVAKNRKNGPGVASPLSIWQRIVTILERLHL